MIPVSPSLLSAEKNAEILSLFKPVEGQVAFYYGRIRNGKTYSATADILDLLDRGEVVFANWNINYQGYDERKHFAVVFIKTLLGRPLFFNYKAENFHYFDPDDVDIPFLGRLVNAHIFIDEGQWILNSHVKDHDPETRKLVLHNGHYARSLNIISQRPINIFKDMRSQVNVWYKCEKFTPLGIKLFRRSTFEDMKDDLPDEENETGRPKVYFPNKRVFDAYNTHAMRAKDAIEMKSEYDLYDTTVWERIKLLLSFVPLPRFTLGRHKDSKQLSVNNNTIKLKVKHLR